jgi:hypothetical protein
LRVFDVRNTSTCTRRIRTLSARRGGTIQAALEPTLGAAESALLGSLGETTMADLLRRVRRKSR